jgi:hypothetical protein
MIPTLAEFFVWLELGPCGDEVTLDVSDVSQTWYRFFGLLNTSARNLGFHGVGLPQPQTHRVPASYASPPQLQGLANLHGWLDCPNNRSCPYIALAIRGFLLVSMQRPAFHIFGFEK